MVDASRYSGSALVLPDPVTPFLDGRGCDDASHLSRQARLRAMVGAATRRIVKQEGMEAFTLRRLSSDTGVSSQTLYNNFGPRDRLVFGALVEYDTVMVDAARGALPGLDGILLLEEGYGACILRQCDYTQAAIRFLFTPDSEALRTTLRHGQRALRAWMEDLRAEGSLRADVDVDALGRMMVWGTMTSLYEWAALGASAEHAGEQLLFRARTTLLGAATKHGAQVIDAYDARPRTLFWR